MNSRAGLSADQYPVKMKRWCGKSSADLINVGAMCKIGRLGTLTQPCSGFAPNCELTLELDYGFVEM